MRCPRTVHDPPTSRRATIRNQRRPAASAVTSTSNRRDEVRLLVSRQRHTGSAARSPCTPTPTHHGRWEGWGSALKPAHEPILVARRPLDGPVAANVDAHGTGALHIDACRVPTNEPLRGGAYAQSGARRWDGTGRWRYPRGRAGQYEQPPGRWPPNLLLVHHSDCVDPQPCAPGCPVAEIDAQSGNRRAGGDLSGTEPSRPFTTVYGDMTGRRVWRSYADDGGASRFYPTFRYCPKPGRSERPRAGDVTHPTVKPVGLVRWLVRLVTPPAGVVLDPFAGSGTTPKPAPQKGPLPGRRTRRGVPAADQGAPESAVRRTPRGNRMTATGARRPAGLRWRVRAGGLELRSPRRARGGHARGNRTRCRRWSTRACAGVPDPDGWPGHGRRGGHRRRRSGGPAGRRAGPSDQGGTGMAHRPPRHRRNQPRPVNSGPTRPASGGAA